MFPVKLSIISLLLSIIITTKVIHIHATGNNNIKYVNTYLGTSYSKLDGVSKGNTYLQIGVPFAHSPWSPSTQTNEDKCNSPYYFDDEYWIGLRKTHFMSGSCVIDYGTVTILPAISDDWSTVLTTHRVNHDAEISTPSVSYYYVLFIV